MYLALKLSSILYLHFICHLACNQAHGGNLNEAVNVHFSEGDRNPSAKYAILSCHIYPFKVSYSDSSIITLHYATYHASCSSVDVFNSLFHVQHA